MPGSPLQLARAGLDRVLTLPARRPRATLLVAGAVVALSLLGILRIHVDASIESMFSHDDPAVGALARVMDRFAAAEEMLVLVTVPDGAPADTARLLAYAGRFRQQVEATPATRDLVDSIAWGVDPKVHEFFERELVPAGLYYLDDATLATARQRLTTEGIRRQIELNERLAQQPGVAAVVSKQILKDPLRLHEFVLDRMTAGQAFKTHGGGTDFVSADGRALLIRVAGKRPPSDLWFSRTLTAALTEAADGANTDGLRVGLGGAYAVAAASERSIRSDSIWSTHGSVLSLLGLFILVYRRPLTRFHLAFLPVLLGIGAGFGAYGFVITRLNPMTAIVGAALAGMGIDYSALVLSRYAARRADGAVPTEAAAGANRDVFSAMFAAWVTTVFGFVAIGMSSVRALSDFAVLGGLGLAGCFFAALTVLPALLVLVDARALRRLTGGAAAGTADRQYRFTVGPLVRWAAGRPRGCVIASLLIVLGAIAVVLFSPGPMLPFESDLSVMHPQPNAPLEVQKELARRFGAAPDSLAVLLRAPSERELVRLAHAIDRRLSTAAARDAGIAGTFGLATLLPDPDTADRRKGEVKPAEIERVLKDFDAAIDDSAFEPSAYVGYKAALSMLLSGRAPPPTLATLRRYPALARTFLPSETIHADSAAVAPTGTATATGPDGGSGNGTGNGAAPNGHGNGAGPANTGTPAPTKPSAAAPVTEAITLAFLTRSADTRQARTRLVEGARQALAGLDGATVTGLVVVGHDTEHAVRKDLPRLLLVALGLVVVYLLLHFRSVRDAAFAMLPPVVSLLCLLAAAHLFGIKINLVNLVALPILIGATVDYGIYLVGLAKPANGEEDFARITASCQAVFICSTTMVLGFGSLVTTSLPALRSLGAVVNIGVISCVAATFLLLAPLLAARRPTRPAEAQAREELTPAPRP